MIAKLANKKPQSRSYFENHGQWIYRDPLSWNTQSVKLSMRAERRTMRGGPSKGTAAAAAMCLAVPRVLSSASASWAAVTGLWRKWLCRCPHSTWCNMAWAVLLWAWLSDPKGTQWPRNAAEMGVFRKILFSFGCVIVSVPVAVIIYLDKSNLRVYLAHSHRWEPIIEGKSP